MLAIAISSCDEDTQNLGNTLTSSVDRFTIAADTFDVQTRSIISDSILGRSVYSYLGCIKDPETGSYVTSDYMTQFHILEKISQSLFPNKDLLINLDDNDLPQADSCFIDIIVSGFQGDSLAAMKLTMKELGKPVKDGTYYYSNYNPETEGYVRQDDNAIVIDKVYSVTDLTLSDSLRNLRYNGTNYNTIHIPLNAPYTDKEGKRYNNYGTYILRKYYEHPEYFKNSLAFTQNVCPGFYFKNSGGLGLVSQIMTTQLNIHYEYVSGDTLFYPIRTFSGTEEVLQTTLISNDKSSIEQLANDDQCTFLKTPAGIFTEVTLPVDDIMKGHESDTITQAKIVFRRMNDYSSISDILLEEPATLLMVEKDSLYSFFENRNVPDNISSYLAYFNKTYNSYTFNNISNLVTRMYKRADRSESWNKVVLIPVEVTSTTSSSSSSTSIANIDHQMLITSIRLVGGKNNQHEPVRISVTYSKPINNSL